MVDGDRFEERFKQLRKVDSILPTFSSFSSPAALIVNLLIPGEAEAEGGEQREAFQVATFQTLVGTRIVSS